MGYITKKGCTICDTGDANIGDADDHAQSMCLETLQRIQWSITVHEGSRSVSMLGWWITIPPDPCTVPVVCLDLHELFDHEPGQMYQDLIYNGHYSRTVFEVSEIWHVFANWLPWFNGWKPSHPWIWKGPNKVKLCSWKIGSPFVVFVNRPWLAILIGPCHCFIHDKWGNQQAVDRICKVPGDLGELLESVLHFCIDRETLVHI